MTNQPLPAEQPETGRDEAPQEAVVLQTVPVSPTDQLLRAKFYERFASQSDQMDALGRQMISIELAIPALYAAILKLLQGKDAVLQGNTLILLTFGCWFVSLLLTFASLFPRNYVVDPTIIKGDPTGKDKKMGLEAFFHQSARYKRRLLIISALFFWAGITAALFLLFS